ncbi:iron-containing alcohol dehydrogenase [Gordonia soli]|uniref:Putative iron-containing alcohol dehydrogenase n=1 Tax=Gordonia soli NBRC 108243 TaxID=1223545 RepID=M0QF39_9ACTN|nr:iron-containing alcohol dehydrogenase [Gordonia soli]GAC67225.1 putative iron-containing alcohol dehydrogenase [Gordonia soli NBRC 108243]
MSSFAFPRFLNVGAGALETAGDALDTLGLSRPLIVTDTFMVSTGAVDRLRTALELSGHKPEVFSETVPDPTTTSLQAGIRAVADHGADSVIGFGGGSPIDTAKALAVLGVNNRPMSEFKAPSSFTGPALPIIAIPTTAGSGSEATQFTVITDDATDEKMLCPGLSFLPAGAILDFELTVSMPPRLTADTAVDALTHAIEAYVSKRANPISDSLALSAISTISALVRRAYADGADREAREGLMMAATQAGIAFSNSSVCLVHGMSRPIGAHFHVAHGLSNAMLLPAVTRFSVHGNVSRYADCARAYGAATETTDDADAAAQLVTAIDRLCADVEVPTPAAYGIDAGRWRQLIPTMAEQAIASGSPGNNPVVPTQVQIQQIYADVYGG